MGYVNPFFLDSRGSEGKIELVDGLGDLAHLVTGSAMKMFFY